MGNLVIDGAVVNAVRRGSDKTITHFSLSDGRLLGYAEAMSFVESGNCVGLIIQSNQYGLYIKSSPDGDTSNNLEELPEYTGK
jgi:hypothetical protein